MQQPGLSDPRLTGDQDRGAAPLPGTLQGGVEVSELRVPLQQLHRRSWRDARLGRPAPHSPFDPCPRVPCPLRNRRIPDRLTQTCGGPGPTQALRPTGRRRGSRAQALGVRCGPQPLVDGQRFRAQPGRLARRRSGFAAARSPLAARASPSPGRLPARSARAPRRRSALRRASGRRSARPAPSPPEDRRWRRGSGRAAPPGAPASPGRM